jgi:hypothetical protein
LSGDIQDAGPAHPSSLLTRVSCGIALSPIGIMEHKKCRPRMTRGDD